MFGRPLKAKNAHHLGPAFFDLLLPNGKMSNANLGNYSRIFQIGVSNYLTPVLPASKAASYCSLDTGHS
jgi:hypothetical protein